MTPVEIISRLHNLGVRLWSDGDRLRYSSPNGALSPALRAEVAEHKADILVFLRQAKAAVSSVTSPPRPISRDGVLPLSFAQQRLWFLDQLVPGSSFYNIPEAISLVGRLNVAALEQSLNEIVRRHEVLRTTFSVIDARQAQIIAPARSVALPAVDLSNLPESEREKQIERLGAAEARRPFDLAQGPLLRATLLKIGDQEHVMLFTMHHIVSDGWSVSVLVQEFRTLYKACSCGDRSPLAELPIQYADFAVWQRQWLQGEVLEAQLDYWKRQLDGICALELPTDRRRPPVQTFRGATRQLALSPSVTEGIRMLSQREGATLFMSLLAAFKAMLYHYSGQEDISVGTAIANRDRPEIENLIGFFVNTLVLRTDLSGNPSFKELLGRVRGMTMDAYAHQALPFERLVEELRPKLDLSRAPLFQVMFALQNAPRTALEAPGIRLSSLAIGNVTAKFDLSCFIVEGADRIAAELEYNEDLFDSPTITRMLEHFQSLLEAVVDHPEQRISELPLLTEAERRRMLVEWNQTQVTYPHDRCIHQLFEAQVVRTPEAVAVVCGEEALTYSKLNARANQVAHHLRAWGRRFEVRVGICLERSLEMIVGLLGILKAGGAYVPLDPSYPKERLNFMLADAHVSVLLTQRRLLSSFESLLTESESTRPTTDSLYDAPAPKLICLDADSESIARESEDNLISEATAENLAYVMYTSGSTGEPKGVSVIHRGVVRLVKETNYVSLTAEDVLLQFAPISFDASTFEIWGSLLNGARLVVMPPYNPSLEELGSALRRYQIMTLWLTSGLFHQMVESQLESLRPVRQLLAGGDVLSTPDVCKTLEGREEGWLINGYGPTEGTTFTCCYPMTASSRIGDCVPIGRPITNTQVYVLNRHWQPVVVGIPGELHVDGAGLARCYLNRPELTAERFIPNPFSAELGARLYRTGDLVRYRPDSNLEFLGRIDHQVKVRGFRVELGEIESVLSRRPGVEAVVVLAIEEAPGEKHLVAYVKLDTERPHTISELRSFLREKLPKHMEPSRFVILESLPLTPTGKVDRQALPAPDQARPELDTVLVAPRTPVEEMLAGIWAEVLRIEQVGVHDNFFEMGGHSLLATQVISRARQAFQVELPLRSLFESPTVASFAQRVEEARRTGESLRIPPIERGARKGALQLSFAQQRIWFLDQLEPGSAIYNMPAAIRLSGHLNINVLDQTLNEVARRHEVLRTTFSSMDGRPIQVIHDPHPVMLSLVDLSAMPDQEYITHLKKLITEESQRPFDLMRGPLLRTTLLRSNVDDHVALVTMHHIVSDGWSFGVLIDEVVTLYMAYSEGNPSPLSELPIQYSDFAVWQRRWMQTSDWESNLSYWKRQLTDAPPALELPKDRLRLAARTYRGSLQSFVLPQNLTRSLRDLSRKEGATLFMTMLAAFDTFLYRYTDQDDILVGAPIANRDKAEIERLIGFFVNTLVMRTDLSGPPSFRELIGRVREMTLGAYAHQSFPFEKIVEELQPERSLAHTPLFQVMLVMQNAPRNQLELPGLKLKALDAQTGTAISDLGLAIEETNSGLLCVLDYDIDLFDDATIIRMIGHIQNLLEEIVREPDKRVSHYQLLSEPERRQLLDEWNDTSRDYPQDECIQYLFEARVEQAPQAIALINGQEHITYAQLNQRANHIAHYLRSLREDQEIRVGICLERSLDMIAALLGVLKAGAAYLPIDPGYPQDRIAFMLEDSQVSVLLTRRHLGRLFTTQNVSVLYLDSRSDEFAGMSGGNPDTRLGGQYAAYLIYTSGSLGKPKGVLVNHSSLVNYARYASSEFKLMPGDRVLQFASISFDAAAEEIFPCLISGATLALRSDSMLDSVTIFLQECRELELTVLDLPTSYWHHLISGLTSEPFWDLGSIRLVIIGGENALPEPLTVWQRRAGESIQLINTYGPTEATIVATMCEPPQLIGPNASLQCVPIGRPVGNVKTYVLDNHLQLVPIGAPGELCIGGAALARGYLNHPEATAEKFIPNPFEGEPGARLYKTGDRVRSKPNTEMEFLGRIDQQVKIRGFRIELGEIESELRRHSGVLEAVVLAREDAPGNKQLVGYVVPRRRQDANALLQGTQVGALGQTLRSYLGKRLPEYMAPSAYVILESLPLTSNGKVDRRMLPPPDRQDAEAGAEFPMPRNAVEEILAGIWSQILGFESVGRHNNFFELGGHSLLATQVISRVRDVFQIELPVRELFESPTVASLAEAIGQVVKSGERVKVPPIERISRDIEMPLSFAQQRLWFLDQLEPNNPFYNLLDSARLTGQLNVPALEQSLGEIINRHEALRTAFAAIKGRPAQIITASQKTALPVVCLAGLPETEREAQALRLAREEEQRPFDLTHGPLLRLKLLRMGAHDHVVFMATHHIISDAWSTGIYIQEIASLYNAFLKGAPPALPELPIQYVDFAYWQQQRMQGEVLESELSYWKQKLDGAPPALELPVDRPRPPVMTYRGDRESVRLPGSLSEALKEVSQRESVTLFMTLLAAFKVLMYRYTGQEDIIIGTAIANRNRKETEGLIGFFTNTLVLRTNLSGDPNFTELLRRVRETALGSYAHQDLPFEKLVEELQPERNLSHTPLFQAMFLLQNTSKPELELAGLTMIPFGGGIATAKFDLNLSIEDTSGGLYCLLEYNVDLFEAATIRRMLTNFSVLLGGVAANPHLRIAATPLLTETERRQLLDDWNDTYGNFTETCVHKLFEEQVEQTPDAVAALCEQESLTYLQLNRRANQVARHMQAMGIGPDVTVGIFVGRSIDMVVGVLAILKTGAAYVPLDPAYPKERLTFMLKDANAPVLLTQRRLLEALPSFAGAVICIDTDQNEFAGQNAENPVSGVNSDNLLYVIYTSGSTGRPKGIGLPHRSLTNLIRWHLATMLKGARTLQFASLSFDASFHEIFAAWCSGGTLLLISEELRRDIVSLARFIQEEGVEKVVLPVVALQQLAEEWGYRDQGAPTLKEVTTTGEQMQITPQITRLFKLWKECATHNHYGPSESHVVTAYTLDENPDHWVARPSIGRPIANTEIYLLDREMEPVPVGVVGELHIGGVSLARGYLDRSDMTAEKFIPNPYRGEPGERLYNTGDLARYGSDGNIEFLGRRDHQVKIRGYRIELGEIEAALSRRPGVRDAVVLARADATKHQRLVAYVTPNQQEPLLVNDLRSFLQEKLPEYMVPSAFVLLQKLPLTPSGKVNRQALPAPEQTRPELEGDFSAPHTHTEEILAGIWGAILGVDRVGLHDNFFELGGHSLLGTQVISRVREAFQVELPLRSLVEAPTVAEFVARIEEAGRAKRGLSVPFIERVSREREIPLSFAQHRLWFLDQLEPGASIYNNSAAVRMTGRLNMSALAQSLGEITRRHEVLRTTFHAVDGQPVQVIGPPEPLTLLVGDLRQAGQQYREVEVLRLATEEAQRPFDLARGPLLRIVVLRLDEEEHVALLTMHHIISDAWSIGLLIRETAALYEAFSRGSRSPLPELNIQFADFSAWQRRWLQGEALQEHLDYWKQQLGAASASVLPTDRPRPAVPSHLGARQPFLLPSALYEGLKRLSYRHGVTLFMTLLAAFQTLLSRCAGQNEVVIGADIANRNRGETEGLIGFFINMLALRTDLSGDPGFLELLSRVREVTLGAFAHQDLPVEILVKELQPERSLSQSPLFQIVFNFINTPMPSLELSGLTLATLESNHQAVRFDVSLMMSEGPDGLSGAWVYSTDLFDAETIARISDRFVTLLHSIVAQPEARISRLEIFSEVEKAGQAKEKKALKESNFRKLMDIKPKDFGRSSERLIKMDFYHPERGLPLVIEPDVEDLDLLLWAKNHRKFIESELLKHGAILFRNFNVSSIARFDRFTRSISPELLDYNERSTPRIEVSAKIYTSTEYPANQAIPLHNELSYSHIWPMKIWFFCLQPAQQGGETPVADSRKVFELLDPGIKQRFMRKKVMYIRNYGDGLGLSWQTVFQTTDRKTVEDYCAGANIEFEWKDGNRLRTRQIGPAVVTHVKTGERVWFNQVHVHCIFSLDQSLRESLLAVVQEKDYPLDINACYGDGSPIEASVLDEIREAYRQTTAVFPWQKGDILMLDNVLVAHGRAPYVGPRKILVAMAEPCKNQDR